jgi:hypothetical protein
LKNFNRNGAEGEEGKKEWREEICNFSFLLYREPKIRLRRYGFFSSCEAVPKLQFWNSLIHLCGSGLGKGVGVAENPRSGVAARGSSVEKMRLKARKLCLWRQAVLPLLNFR